MKGVSGFILLGEIAHECFSASIRHHLEGFLSSNLAETTLGGGREQVPEKGALKGLEALPADVKERDSWTLCVCVGTGPGAGPRAGEG